jgi:DNA-binding PadR family transcriptional regulator
VSDHRPLNATAASLLGFLHDGPLSGYELAATAQRVIGNFWTLTQSQVYRELAWMAEAGLVTPGERGARERQPFALTDAGRAAFAKWIDRPPDAETIRHPLLLTVSFGRFLAPDRLATFLRRHREAHAELLRTYEAQARAMDQAPQADPFRRATLGFGIAYERAVLDWFAALPPTLSEGEHPPDQTRKQEALPGRREAPSETAAS